MIKQKSLFICQQCGYESARWFGKCPECGGWNTTVETVTNLGTRDIKTRTEPVSLDSIPKGSTSRISTRIQELDRVLGGGLVPGQVILIAGEPGIGKSTLLLQVADNLAENDTSRSTTASNQQATVLYVSGEESVNQIKVRADRLGIRNKDIRLLEETNVDSVLNTISTLQGLPLKGLIVDSIQTMATSDLSGMAGSVGQVRECAFRLVRFAKENGVVVFIVGHVTKEGTVAGPSVLMHIVDTVLWFEGDKTLTTRILRAVKNRFGSTDEVGIFSMEDKGLISLSSPEKLFLTSSKKRVAGSCITSILEGTRPILVEIQALVVPTKMAFAKRVTQGIDVRRLELLLAVLIRRCGLPLYESDVFVNLAGGIAIKNDPSADLAVCLAIASAYFDKPLPKACIAVGEVGLLGDIREVVAQEKRIKEAKSLGYSLPITGGDVNSLQEAIRKYIN